MERLTNKAWRNFDPWECCGQDKYCQRGCHDPGGCTKGCIVPQLYARLGAYEDTELTSEEIDMDHEAAEQLRRLCRDYDLDRLEELVKADKDGRLVVLPCKVGDTIYHIGKVRTSHFETDKIIIDDEGRWEIYEMPFALMHLPYIGESDFLTREEAETALKVMKDE